jgi:hypothetical protein
VTLWRVQVLPSGPVAYKGSRALDFTREYLDNIAEAFGARVFDFVPFQLAENDNAHTSDPSRYRGEVRALEVVSDGLDAVIDATPEGDEAIRTSPDLAAAPRLVESYRTSCGRVFPVVLQHVLGTTAPMAAGLRGWQELETNQDAQFAEDLANAVSAERERAAIPAPAPDLTRDMNDMRDWGANGGSVHDALRKSARDAHAGGRITQSDLEDRLRRIAFMERQDEGE